jgi:hypothetical protein
MTRGRSASTLVFLLLLTGGWNYCVGDEFILAPSAPGGPTETANGYPFLIKQLPIVSMRYQQVYNASLFTNVDASLFYVTSLNFLIYAKGPAANPWTITNMQINLSTTARTAGNLSTNFAENVGADEVVVFGPGSFRFPGNFTSVRQTIPFAKPFKYHPPLGNLLVDVRIFDGRGPLQVPSPAFDAYNSNSDEIARLFATNVTASSGSVSDTTGLTTDIRFSPIPSLKSEFFPVYETSASNMIVISWPPEPSTFLLQRTDRLGSAANWQPVTNQVYGTFADPARWIEIPRQSADTSGFFRLFWPGGY